MHLLFGEWNVIFPTINYKLMFKSKVKQVSSIESSLSEKKCVLVEAVAVCEIEMFAEETITVLPAF